MLWVKTFNQSFLLKIKTVSKKQKCAKEPRWSYVCVQIVVVVVVSCRGTALLTAALQELGKALQRSFPIVVDHLWSGSTTAALAAANIGGGCLEQLRRDDHLPNTLVVHWKDVTELEITLTRASSIPPLRQYAGLMDSFLLLAERRHVEVWPEHFPREWARHLGIQQNQAPAKASKLRFLGRPGRRWCGIQTTKQITVIHRLTGEREHEGGEHSAGTRLDAKRTCCLSVLVCMAALTLRSSPAGKNLRVGKLWTLTASISLAVESILATMVSALSLYFSPSFSQMGASCLQCPHQGASGTLNTAKFDVLMEKRLFQISAAIFR